MNYRRQPEKIIIPYPYLTETTYLSVDGIANTVRPLPVEGATTRQWYLVQTSQTVTIPANHTLVIVQESGGTQLMMWDSATTSAAQQRSLQAGDRILLYNSRLVPIQMAGFEVMILGDSSGSTASGHSHLVFPTNIFFNFTNATN